MRVLVEQTASRVEKWLENLKLDTKPTIHVLMGGEDETHWDLHPEQEAILIGTQDMIISRALNRGYALSRYRWPVQFGLLNNDCLWVLDEVQLMGSGLATTAQLEAFRKLFGVWGRCHTLWASATLDTHWLETVDFREHIGKLKKQTLTSEDGDNEEISKRLKAKKLLHKLGAIGGNSDKLAKQVLNNSTQEHLILVVLNTVARATELYKKVKKALNGADTDVLLLHSRFRPVDRKAKVDRLFQMQKANSGIVISTQVVEAGVDISAKILFTELCPWPSFVQRVGRCNRRGECDEGKVFWIDLKKKDFAPYESTDLDVSRKYLEQLEEVGPSALKKFTEKLSCGDQHVYVIRRHDIYGLFSTESDLAGGYTDISHFIRNIEQETDVYVYWRDFKHAPTPDEPPPIRDELCSVGISAFKKFLNKNGVAWLWNPESRSWEALRSDRIRPGMTLLLSTSQGGYDPECGWTGNTIDKPEPVAVPIPETSSVTQDSLIDDNSSEVATVSLRDHLLDAELEARDLIAKLSLHHEKSRSDAFNAVVLASRWHDVGKALSRWQGEARNQLRSILEKANKFVRENVATNEEVQFITSFIEKVETVLKSSEPLAKFPSLERELAQSNLPPESRRKIRKALWHPFIVNLRHEAASALAAWRKWQDGEDNWTALAVYLIASHHGKVRTVLRSINFRAKSGSSSTEESINVFGIKEGDSIPKINGWLNGDVKLSLDPKTFGATGNWTENDEFIVNEPSWIQMVAELLGPELPDDPDPTIAAPPGEPRALGPFKLAFLEALVRAADVRASRYPGRLRKHGIDQT
jgi:CRISPR-associated endonuclease/helicase Cas3